MKKIRDAMASIRFGLVSLKFRLITLLALSVIIVPTYYSFPTRQTDIRAIRPVLAFKFDCKNRSPKEELIETLLRDKNFKFINIPKARLKRKLAPMPFSLFIDGIDESRRMINFTSLQLDTYSTALYNPPSVERSPDLEEAILAFVGDTLGCAVRQITRNDKADSDSKFYEELFEHRNRMIDKFHD